jgi:hypothetical protein
MRYEHFPSKQETSTKQAASKQVLISRHDSIATEQVRVYGIILCLHSLIITKAH